MREVVGDRAAGQVGARVAGGAVGRKTIRVIAEARGIDAAELDREVGRAAVVGRVEPVRLAASVGAHLDDLHARTDQPVDDRLARRTGLGRGEHDDA